MQWLKVILAGFIEIIWVTGLDRSALIVYMDIYPLFIALSFF